MSRRRWLLFLGLYAGVTTFAACTYDWPAGRPSASDAAPDGPPSDASLVDRLGSDAGDATPDAVPPPDAGPDSAPNCAKLLSDVAQTRSPAKKCQQGISLCAVKLLDECDCNTYVDEAGTQNVLAYQKAVAALKAVPACLRCPPVGGCKFTSAVCIFDPDAGVGTFCYP